MQIKGKLIQTTGVEQITDTFKKTNLIIETEYESQYPQEVAIEVHNDNIAKLAECGAKAGDVVIVECNLRGRKYQKEGDKPKWFNTIVLWKISKSDEVVTVATATAENVVNDLPF
jgi:hypothetical protein